MAIKTIKATIQVRHGNEEDLDPEQLTTAEFAMAEDTKKLWLCFKPGLVGRLALYDDINNSGGSSGENTGTAIYYGETRSESGGNIKIVICPDFKLESGAIINIKFLKSNIAESTLYLNINGTGAQKINYNGSYDNVGDLISGGNIYTFRYNGNEYDLIGVPSFASASAGGLMSKEDKAKLDNISSGGGVIDSDLDEIWEVLERLEARVRDLAHVDLAFEYFTNDVNVAEKGASVDVTVNWQLNTTPEEVWIYPPSGGEEVTKRSSKTYNNVSEDTTWHIDAIVGSGTDNSESAEATTSVHFYDGVYYGASSYDMPSLNNLTKSLQADRNITFEVNAGKDEYIWYACPASYGVPALAAGGIEGGFKLIATMNSVNDYGYITAYQFWRSSNSNLGKQTITVS